MYSLAQLAGPRVVRTMSLRILHSQNLFRSLRLSFCKAIQCIEHRQISTLLPYCRSISAKCNSCYLPNECSTSITSFLPTSLMVIPRRHMTLNQKRKRGKFKKKKKKVKLFGNPQMRGIILKLVIRKPRKPNSAQRKCALVKLSNGKRVHAYIPGVGHNLQDHNIVLVQGGGPQDTPGVKYSIIRGKYDCAHVVKKQN